MSAETVHLTAGGVSVVLALDVDAMPVVVHWGRALGPVDDEILAALARNGHRQRVVDEPDAPRPVGVVPEARQGWLGFPGVAGLREGRAPFAAFARVEATVAGERAVVTGRDDAAGLMLRQEIELTGTGVLRIRAALRNIGEDAFTVSGLDIAVPIPARAASLLDFTGRHSAERRPQRAEIVDGTHLRESRHGRTGPDAVTLLVAGEPGFGPARGEVWAAHLAWSGNQRVWAHRTNGGYSFLGAGELLDAGELVLEGEEEYTTPWLVLTYGEGLDEASARIHEMLRARPEHPAVGRPITLNTWEAVYFDHEPAPLFALADLAAGIGVERFVLDDGWFRGRRHDRAGLGDWYEDETVWPEGLAPLVDHVRAAGMQFGLWFEPEMANPDSDLARVHPEWILSPIDRDAPLARNQLVVNVAHPDAFAYLRERLVDIITRHRVDYVKWDHNRDLIEPIDRRLDRPRVHRQTQAVYALMRAVKDACPWLEIESCSSGGGRIDLGVVEVADRFWTSDSNDPLERQRIQRGTSLLVPPEMLGSHVGAQVAHVTGRASSMTFRAITALTGSFGIEWDLREATDAERAELAGWIRIVKDVRPVVERGRLHRLETEDALIAQAIVAPGRERAIATLTAIDSPAHVPGGFLRIPGLDPAARYRVRRILPDGADDPTRRRAQPGWWTEGAKLPGGILAEIGLPLPTLRPQDAALVEFTRI